VINVSITRVIPYSMHIRSGNMLYVPMAALRSSPPSAIPSSTPSTANPKEATSTNAGPSRTLNKSLQASGHDQELAKLKARDREVRAHEAAHAAAAGSLTKGGPSFTFQRGSDGRLYAVGGEVNIDTTAVAGDPESTIQKARQIRAAANAPANPSAQDRAIAAQATRMEAQARRELQQERTERIQNATFSTSTPTTPPSSAPKIIDIFA